MTHIALDKLQGELKSALRAGDIEATHLRLDMFWSRFGRSYSSGASTTFSGGHRCLNNFVALTNIWPDFDRSPFND